MVPACFGRPAAFLEHGFLGFFPVDRAGGFRCPGVRVECFVPLGDVAFLDLVVGGSADSQLLAELRDTRRVGQARIELDDLTAYRRR